MNKDGSNVKVSSKREKGSKPELASTKSDEPKEADQTPVVETKASGENLPEKPKAKKKKKKSRTDKNSTKADNSDDPKAAFRRSRSTEQSSAGVTHLTVGAQAVTGPESANSKTQFRQASQVAKKITALMHSEDPD